MLTEDEARQIAKNYVSEIVYDVPDDELVLLEGETIEKPYGWIFFYASKRWIETGDIAFAIAGNAPFLVENSCGNVVVLGTAHSVEDVIKSYERCVRDGRAFDPLRLYS